MLDATVVADEQGVAEVAITDDGALSGLDGVREVPHYVATHDCRGGLHPLNANGGEPITIEWQLPFERLCRAIAHGAHQNQHCK